MLQKWPTCSEGVAVANGRRPHALGQFYTELLATALCYHLIAHHTMFERRLAVDAGARLLPAVLARLDTYLEAYAELAVTLEVLVGLANLSIFHFARRSKYTTSRSPYKYVPDWKIQWARVLLWAGELPVATIGAALVFFSPAHFAAASKRAVGQAP